MAKAISAIGIVDLIARYWQVRQGCDLRSMPYFGVRVKSE